MRLQLSALFALLTSSAFATGFPISGVYGSSEVVCRMYLEHGYLVDGEGITEELALIVTPEEIAFIEGGCRPTTIARDQVSLECGAEGFAWSQKIELSISLDGSVLTYFEGGEPLQLLGDDGKTVVETTETPVSAACRTASLSEIALTVSLFATFERQLTRCFRATIPSRDTACRCSL